MDLLTTHHKYTVMKSQAPEGMIIFFLVGSFYEAYFGDAQTVSDRLSLPLHKRGEAPCVAVPYHSIYRIQDELEKKHYLKSIVVTDPRSVNN